MEIRKYLAILLVFTLAGSILFLMFGNVFLTGEVILREYTFTKAICDENHYCQDYEIVCNGNKTISTSPITGSAVQFLDDWKDPRPQEAINKECE